MDLHYATPLAIFVVTYLVLGAGKLPLLRLDRTGATLVGAVAMVVTGALSERQAAAAINFRTLGLLLGMMIVVANLRLSGAFTLMATTMLGRARSGFGLLAMTVAAAGVLAAFFINDVVCLALTPLLIDASVALELSPVPFLLALAAASNAGSVATITGNPQNMIVAGFAGLSYGSFLMRLAPASIAGLAIVFTVVALTYRNELGGLKFDGGGHLRSEAPLLLGEMVKSVFVALGALVGFAVGFPTHLVALSAGAVLLFTRRIRPQDVYQQIDWTMLLMFGGLFVVLAGAETTGLQHKLLAIIGADRLSNSLVLALVTVMLANLVSAVPAVLLFLPFYPTLARHNPGFGILLASTSTFAGNLTVLGSMANLIVIEEARRQDVEITFGEYVRVGVPITLLTITVDLILFELMASG